MKRVHILLLPGVDIKAIEDMALLIKLERYDSSRALRFGVLSGQVKELVGDKLDGVAFVKSYMYDKEKS